jgi:hypothetical protein
MTPGQHDAAMIDHLRRRQLLNRFIGEREPFDQRPAASRAPIRLGLFVEHGPTLAANPFHTYKITGFSLFFTPATL